MQMFAMPLPVQPKISAACMWTRPRTKGGRDARERTVAQQTPLGRQGIRADLDKKLKNHAPDLASLAQKRNLHP